MLLFFVLCNCDSILIILDLVISIIISVLLLLYVAFSCVLGVKQLAVINVSDKKVTIKRKVDN